MAVSFNDFVQAETSVIVAYIHASPFATSPLSTLPENTADLPVERIQSLLLAYYRLLIADPRLASRLDWPTAPLHALREHSDAGVRLLAVHTLAKIRGWSEARRAEMEASSGLSQDVDAPVVFRYELADGQMSSIVVDGWMLPVLEDRRVRAYSPDITTEVATEEDSFTAQDLCRRTAVLGGRLFLSNTANAQPLPSTHVSTAAMDSAIAEISPRLQRGIPILISAPPSAGKTHIVQHLSSQLYPSHQPTNRILTIPLADTTIDVKSLIGTYVSSPTKPGTFEWMEGALAKSVRAGRWVVFEDIDKASLEMLVTISGLTKSLALGRVGRRATLPVPGRDEIEAGDGFAVFATRTIRAEAATPATFFGHLDFEEVSLEAPTDEEILSILEAQFPALPRSVTATLVGVWRDLRPLAMTSGQVKARDISLRDLEKWCARVRRALPPPASLAALESSGAGVFANAVFQDETFLEGADIFLASLDNRAGSPEKRARMVAAMASGLGMEVERATSLIDSRRPRLEAEKGSPQIHVGRYSLDAATTKRRVKEDDRPYALTRPSLVALERIAASVSLAEPALLVGETGTGKTTSVQHLANLVGKSLTALNLSTQTETSDLVGGFKPIDAAAAARTLHARWQKLFTDTFSVGKAQNGAYLEAAAKALSARKWGRCADLWSTSARRAVDKLNKTKEKEDQPEDSAEVQATDPRKRRKVVNKAARAAVLWQALLVDIADFDLHHVKMKSKLVFSFVEGPLVKALKNGEWILLDEVNLATQETLEAIATILEASTASLVLTERGDVEPIPRHPDFRLFACMNPATDVGKKDLPAGLRARFTELYVPPPDDDREALVAIVEGYLGDAAAGDRGVILDVVELYSSFKRLSAAKEIVDGSNVAPHYSMRTLARALMFAVQTAPIFGLRRGLWEGVLMAFTMSLDVESARKAHEICEKYILGPMKNARAVLAQVPTLPRSLDADDFVRFGPFWLRRGPLPPAPESRYIITASVQAKLSDLARVILTKRYPVLIQGPTSAGKTSAVEFLARQTGHRFVRINNHEHTDIQEYLGTYVTDPQTGNLVFQEGLLVTAVRQGHWIVLDELNLAPTDVLEALNRLLDDNRELVIPETQEVIKPHPNFILFATQNPPGLYAGRKVLSRAFRNRFLEVHFDDVPKDELETILCQRCAIAPTYAKKIVQVFEELRHRRQASRVFESKSSFATLRDLFRWAERKAVGYQQLADDGYMLLAERARSEEDKVVIKDVIEKIMKVTIDVENMYSLFDGDENGIFSRLPFKSVEAGGLVWTKAMQRLFALVAAAAAHDEPVLLVGETGCGKTSVCEVLAAAFQQKLVGINCHQNMETADLLGSQRPVRNRHERRGKVLARLAEIGLPADAANTDDELLAICVDAAKTTTDESVRIAARECQLEIKKLSALFEWVDGPLIHAMVDGELLLLDEVSLADDSVLERLNSVLEPGRTLVLAEKGGADIDEATIVAHPGFHVVATMNPGGDFGKKELSPALRNRFTEIWVPALGNRDDLLQIIAQSCRHEALTPAAPLILDFLNWFGERVGDSSGLGLRDILAWVNFANQMLQGTLDVPAAFHHGGQMVIVDGLESLPQVAGSSAATVAALRQDCMDKLSSMAATLGEYTDDKADITFSITSDAVAIAGFSVPRGPLPTADTAFRFNAPTTALNSMRVLRGCQLPKAILLEGSPGVGKTSLVSALAATAGYTLQRINLSDQTDLIDLFGSDLPVEGGAAGEFQWRDAAFLDAMQKGDWVLLDEMNLASQTVLEGLNAVLDHRGTVYIPELGRSFDRHPSFRVFAAQNPLTQGGGRKGLPKSFLNRFTKVYLQEHTPEDLLLICRGLHPAPEDIVQRMITFNETIRSATMVTRTIGREGSPWEFNLRDLFRWFGLLAKRNGLETSDHPVEHLATVYLQRFRNAADRAFVARIFEDVFGVAPRTTRPQQFITPSYLQIGHSAVPRTSSAAVDVPISSYHLPLGESVLKAVEMGWLVILAGDAGRGKRELVQSIADAAGRPLGEFAMHPGVDTSEILGTFEQQDPSRVLDAAVHAVRAALEAAAESHPAAATYVAQLTAAREQCNDARALDAVSNLITLARSILVEVSAVGIDVKIATKAVAGVEKAGPSASGFAWVDGQLLDAIRSGGWFLVSDANLCSASVLDRLNSLCEIDGVLVMSEKGSASGVPEVITPHPDFRLFMTYDPRHGELSRAMRNRGVELYVDAPDAPAPAVPASFALSDNAIMRSTETTLAAYDDTLNRAPFTATLAASQSRVALPILTRLAALGDDALTAATHFLCQPRVAAILAAQREALAERGVSSSLAAEVPFDPSLDDNTILGEFGIVRALQLVLRNASAKAETDAWLADSANSKTVIAMSAQTARRGTARRKPAVGDTVYPFITLLRDELPDLVLDETADSNAVLSASETTFMLLSLMESHTRTEAFDYSSIQLLAAWLSEQLAKLPSATKPREAVKALAQITELSTGLGQAAIWTLFRSGVLPSDQRATLRELADRLGGVSDVRLRLDAVQALVAAAKAGVPEEAVTELSALIESLPRRDYASTAADTPWTNAAVAHVIELDLLTCDRGRDEKTLTLLASSADARPSDLLSILAPGSGSGATLAAVAGWLRRLWDETTPGTLFQPVNLAAALRFSRATNTPLAEISVMDEALKFTTNATLWSAGRGDDRVSKASNLVFGLLRQVLGAFGASVVNVDRQVTLQYVSMPATEDEKRAIEYLNECFKTRLAGPLAEYHLLVSLAHTGQIWYGLGRFILDLFVTNVPIDPGVRRVLLGEVAASQLNFVREEWAVAQHADIRAKGVSDSARASALAQRILELETEEATLGPQIDRPTNAARLGHLFTEVFSFAEDVLSDKAGAALMAALDTDATNALPREDAFQLASMSFVTRLTGYSDLEDLAAPIATAVLCAKFGFRCVARNLELKHASPPAALAPIVSFPAIGALQTLQTLPTIGKGEPTTLSMRLDLLSALAYARDMTEPEQRIVHVPGLVSGLDRLYAAWSAIRTREALEKQEAESMYRIRKTDIEVLSDEELEEKEFAQLFPTFDGDLEDEEEKEEIEEEADAPSKHKAKFRPEMISAFHALVLGSFGKETGSSLSTTLKTAVDEVLSLFTPDAFREDIDSSSLAFQVATLHHRHTEIRAAPPASNFYFSPNEFEVRKAWAFLERMRTRLDELVAEWPDQMVLQHMRERVLRILKLDVRSPIAKVLAALEQLLLHTDDWEPYAHRENSLKHFQLEVSGLIVAWRRLELSCWVRLLDDQAQLYVAKDDEFTLRLYGAVIHGTVSAENVDEYLTTVLPVISTYINGATQGQFEYRLSVLAAFQSMATELSRSDAPAAASLGKVAAVLANVLAHARLFLPRVHDSVAHQRKIIDGGVKDYVKLASWKDINVFALKASAQKSHKQLHKHIRKFREVLMQPVASILGDSNSICPQDAASSTDSVRTGLFEVTPLAPGPIQVRAESQPAVPGLLAKLDDTLQKYTTVHTAARPSLTTTEGEQLESMAVNIIETAAMLQKATPATLTKENTKKVNNLASRKRKAFADLLKSLRACGFSQAVRADQLGRQQSTTWLASLPALATEDLPAAFDTTAVTKVSDYHHRQGVLMATLRAAFNGHSPDIASQDLGRGIGFTESLYASALGEHAILATQLSILNKLTATIRRLHHCANASALTGGDALHTALMQAELDACHLREALREVEEGVRHFRELQGVQISTSDLTAVHEFRQEIGLLVTAIELALSSTRAAEWSLFGHDEASLINRLGDLLQRIVATCEARTAASPELRHLFAPLAEMARGVTASVPLRPKRKLADSVWSESDAVIQALLVVAQSMDSSVPEPPKEDEYPHIPTSFARQTKATASLRVNEVIDRLASLAKDLAGELAGQESSVAPAALARVLPFVETLAETYAESISAHLSATKGIYKLNYVVARVMLDLAQRGFCKPQEESKDDNKDAGDDGKAEGTGMGAGSGDKNVSEEITDESQVEGLQGEEEEEQEDKGGDDDDDDDAVSMENDFDGKLDDGKEKDKDDDASGDEDDEEEDEPDDHVGDVDPLDPGAVDEKFWNDEKEEEEEKDQEGREDLMNQKNEENGESELAAKDGAKEDKKKNKEDDIGEQEQEKEESKDNAESNEAKPDQEDGDDEVEEMEEQEDQAEDDGDNEGPDMPQQDNVAADEGDRLDLPEDLDLGGDEEEGEEEANPEQNFDDDIEMSDHEDGPDDHGQTSDQEGAEEDPENAPDATGATEDDADAEQEQADTQNLDMSASNDATAQEAAAAGRGQGSANKDESGEDEEMMEGEEDDAQQEEEDADAEG